MFVDDEAEESKKMTSLYCNAAIKTRERQHVCEELTKCEM